MAQETPSTHIYPINAAIDQLQRGEKGTRLNFSFWLHCNNYLWNFSCERLRAEENQLRRWQWCWWWCFNVSIVFCRPGRCCPRNHQGVGCMVISGSADIKGVAVVVKVTPPGKLWINRKLLFSIFTWSMWFVNFPCRLPLGRSLFPSWLYDTVEANGRWPCLRAQIVQVIQMCLNLT